MDLVTLITACALGADPKLMHALVWQQSGGEPWAVSVPGEHNPRVYRSMDDAIRETRETSTRTVVRVGLAGVSVPAVRVSAAVLLPCRNVAMAAVQISRNIIRCRTHAQLKDDPTFCAVAVYRGSWTHPDVKFATEVAASAAKGDTPNFDMPRGTSTEIFDIADEPKSDPGISVIDITATAAEQLRSWSSALFPPPAMTPGSVSDGTKTALPSALSAAPAPANTQGRGLFVHPSVKGPSQ